MTKEILKGINGIEFHIQYDGMLTPEHKKQILDKLNSSHANVRSLQANQDEPQRSAILGQIATLALTCTMTGCPTTTITPGTTVNLTLTPTGGVSPYTYIWYLNDDLVEETTSTYSISTLVAGTDNIIFGTVVDSTYAYCYKICTANVATAVSICSWISGKGGPTAIVAFDIMTLVGAYSGQQNLGFTVSSVYIMGAVAYYLGNNTSGNSLTGCTF